MLQLLLALLIIAIPAIPLGNYMYSVAQRKKTFADPLFDPVDRLVYRLCGIDCRQMSWKSYAAAAIGTNMIMMLAGYLILRLQGILINPTGLAAVSPDLALHTVASFITNTNLQHYSGESTLTNLSQMLVIIFMMFTSSATGYSVAMAFSRGLTGKPSMGNYFEDMVRITTRVLLPLSLVAAVILISQGVPQTFGTGLEVTTLEGNAQQLVLGPVASLESIKHIGTNGGGFFGANSTMPFENPTALSNLIEILSMTLLPLACVITFGRMAMETGTWEKKNRIKRPLVGKEARSLLVAMSLLFIVGLSVCYFAELAGNPRLAAMGIGGGSMEGKEVRFGIAQSSLFTTVTTAFTTGSVNNMHDALTPLGNMVAQVNMMLNVVFGGKGVGLMNILVYVILTVFICGLLIGRTPSYLGRRIEGKEMTLAALCILVHPFIILAFSALATIGSTGTAHELSRIMYEYASSAANNGSGMEALADNTLFWNLSTTVVMLVGRYLPIALQLALAGTLCRKAKVATTAGTLRTDGLTFALTLFMVVVLLSALTFFPILALGPITEHLVLWAQ